MTRSAVLFLTTRGEPIDFDPRAHANDEAPAVTPAIAAQALRLISATPAEAQASR